MFWLRNVARELELRRWDALYALTANGVPDLGGTSEDRNGCKAGFARGLEHSANNIHESKILGSLARPCSDPNRKIKQPQILSGPMALRCK